MAVPASATRRILVVDDDPSIRRMLERTLQAEGYDTRTAADGGAALATAESWPPHAIVLDVVMPGIDGGNLAAKIKSDALLKNVPIVFLTAVVSPKEAGAQPKHIGGFPFLAKPVSPEVLERCIEEHLPQT